VLLSEHCDRSVLFNEFPRGRPGSRRAAGRARAAGSGRGTEAASAVHVRSPHELDHARAVHCHVVHARAHGHGHAAALEEGHLQIFSLILLFFWICTPKAADCCKQRHEKGTNA
jgi:hypothetical protein